MVIAIIAISSANFLAYGSSQDLHHIPQFTAFKHPYQLQNLNVKKASKAVVLINNSATGFFVNYKKNNYLMTNDHVLGSNHCAISGCYINIDVDFEHNKTSKNITLFVTPEGSRADIDVAIFSYKQVIKIHNNLTLTHYTPPYILQLANKINNHFSKNKSSKNNPLLTLSNQAISSDDYYLIGHPRTGLKKYSTGKIIQLSKGYIYLDAFSLPGNSGSPIVNQKGKLVGIHHSSKKRNDMFSRTQLIYLSRGSSLGSLKKILQAADQKDPLYKRHYININNKRYFKKAKKLWKAYMLARKNPTIYGSNPFFSHLYDDCKKNIDLSTFNIKKYQKSYHSCTIAFKSINNCINLAKNDHQKISFVYLLPPAKSIPSNSQHRSSSTKPYAQNNPYCESLFSANKNWNKLFNRISRGYQRFAGAGDSSKMWGHGHVIASRIHQPEKINASDITKFKQLSLNQVLIITKSLADYHRYFKSTPNISTNIIPKNTKTTHQNKLKKLLKSSVINFDKHLGYQYQLETLAEMAINLHQANIITKNQLINILRKIQNHQRLTLYSKLAIEKMIYKM